MYLLLCVAVASCTPTQTNVGTILISINPFTRLPLYTPEVIQAYHNKGSKEMPPHVYNIAGDALKGVIDFKQYQSIIVRCARFCLRQRLIVSLPI